MLDSTWVRELSYSWCWMAVFWILLSFRLESTLFVDARSYWQVEVMGVWW